ncbi:MAG: argininosuccinate lyase [Methanomassiliicoccaceae archaeon]|nr:argininosuccinate lyase [Methanomassiliicoccaceae archaeon]
MGQKALWSGRYDGGMDDSTLEFTSSLDTDLALGFYDIMGSIAHVTMLRDCGVLSGGDAGEMIEGLRAILKDVKEERLEIDCGLEDIHTNIEHALTMLKGPVGGKLHTGRSRNDQVATDLRMYLRDAVLEAAKDIDILIKTLTDLASNSLTVIMPGFTHMQHAQPVTAAQHMMAHAFRLGRDAERFLESFERINVCPLGAGALAGTTYPIDRKQTSDLLGFGRPTENSMDSVSDRDFVIETAFCASMLAVHLSSMAEELILWSSPEFGFIEMDDRYTTGSSMMPQKKNPDVAELIRGRTGGIIGDLVAALVLMKGLPLTYNRDLQEDKKIIMGSVHTAIQCTLMMSKIISTMRFDADRMSDLTKKGYINATDMADYLVAKGMPFREAYGAVGSAVRFCIREKRGLEELTLSEMKEFSGLIDDDVFDVLPIEKCVERRCSLGGTSPRSVEAQISGTLSSLTDREGRISRKISAINDCWNKLAD